MSSTDPKMFQLVNKNTSQSCRFWIDSLILICHDEAVLLEEKLKRAKWFWDLLSKFQFGEMIPFIMLDHIFCYSLNIILPRADNSNQTKSDQIKSNDSLRSSTQIIHLNLYDHLWSFRCCRCFCLLPRLDHMQLQSLNPSVVTFTSALSGCSMAKTRNRETQLEVGSLGVWKLVTK